MGSEMCIRDRVPPPCSVSLRCVDERSGAVVESERVSFTTLEPWAHDVETLAAGVPPPWEFRAPTAKLLIFTTPNRYGASARVLDLMAGKNEVVLELRERE